MKEHISSEVQKWFDEHPEKEVAVKLPTDYRTATAVYDIRNANIPVFGHYAIVFDGEMEVWVANSLEDFEQQLKNTAE